jgi:septal ring factor EnvC (AmiA/AmiB activator)
MFRHLNHSNILICFCLALVGKSFFISPSIADALIFLFTATSLCFNKYLVKDKLDQIDAIRSDIGVIKTLLHQQSEENEALTTELKTLKGQVSTNNMSKIKKTDPYKF